DYSIQIFLRLSWHDSRLAFNASAIGSGGGCRGQKQKQQEHQQQQQPTVNESIGLTIDPRLIDEIWLPDIIFVNEKQAKYHDITIPNKLLRVKPNGDVYYSTRISLRLGCHMALYRFPLDTQVCEINMESYFPVFIDRFTKQELILQWRKSKPFEVNKDFHLPQFVLTSWNTSNCDIQYLSGEFPCLRVHFVLRRVFAVYLIQYYVPALSLSCCPGCPSGSALKPCQHGYRVMTVLSMTTQSMGLWMTLPKASYIKAIDIWMGVTVMYVFSAMLEFAMVNTMARNEIRRVTRRIRKAAAKRSMNGNAQEGDTQD
uniref:Neur_chan_LBD domain-containing protein n=1 Tax=Macrostomum lignano TaxID=282301 RepID=A0A1I8I8J8_9PLAT